MREGWTKTSLGNVCGIQSGSGFPKRLQGSADGDYPFYKVSDMNASGNERFMSKSSNYISDGIRKELGAKIFSKGALIFPKVGGAIVTNKKRQITAASCVDNNVMGLIPNLDFIDPDFLRYFMDSVDIYDLSNKANPPSIRQITVSNWPVLLPPLPEQKRIVAILDEAFSGIDTAIANTEKNLANARELFESYLNSVFIKNSSAWGKVRLETICEKITVGHVGSMASRYKPEGVPLLRSQNIRPFNVDLNKVVFIDEGFHKELKKSALQPGDLGIVRTGYPGTAAVIPDSLPVANCSDLVIVRPGERVLSDFLAIVFNSYYGKKEVAGVLVGAAQKHFNVTAAKAALIPLPAIDEQRRVVVECSDLREEHQRLESIYQQKLTALTELKQSLLQKAFSGELTADRAGHEIEGAAIAARISSRGGSPLRRRLAI